MSEIKYPLCKSLGLDIYKINPTDFICASDLESILKKATVVYLNEIKDSETINYTNNPNTIFGASCTHTALLIGIKEIKEKTTLEKIDDVVNDCLNGISRKTDAIIEIKKLIEAADDKK